MAPPVSAILNGDRTLPSSAEWFLATGDGEPRAQVFCGAWREERHTPQKRLQSVQSEARYLAWSQRRRP